MAQIFDSPSALVNISPPETGLWVRGVVSGEINYGFRDYSGGKIGGNSVTDRARPYCHSTENNGRYGVALSSSLSVSYADCAIPRSIACCR